MQKQGESQDLLTQNNREQIRGHPEPSLYCDAGVLWESDVSSVRITKSISAARWFGHQKTPLLSKPLISPAPIDISLTGWSPGVFLLLAQAIRADVCFMSVPALTSVVPTVSNSSLGSCCFLLLLLHGSCRSDSLLITKGTHGQISAPPKIGTPSYTFSLPKIIKL